MRHEQGQSSAEALTDSMKAPPLSLPAGVVACRCLLDC